HGTSAYAAGLLVDDAQAALQRAVALGAERFAQSLDAGEIEMPAVRGVGGGILYFLDRKSELGRIWEIEFDAIEDDTPLQPAGLQ
ncbi:3-keto-5-aminohexanoate cleavage protein, partial [Rhizobium sp. 13T]|nr:3-keto-5-aminohexanoate cleavage protein [Rhizobium croatiense]